MADEYLQTASPIADYLVGTNPALVIDFTLGGARQRFTLGGNVTIAGFNGMRAGVPYDLWFKQDAVGSHTVTWPSNMKWQGGSAPTITATAAYQDKIVLVWDPLNATYLAVASQNYH